MVKKNLETKSCWSIYLSSETTFTADTTKNKHTNMLKWHPNDAILKGKY